MKEFESLEGKHRSFIQREKQLFETIMKQIEDRILDFEQMREIESNMETFHQKSLNSDY